MSLTVIELDGAGTAGLPQGDPRSILGHVSKHLADSLGCRVHREDWEASLMGVGGTKPWPDASHNAVIRVAHHIRTHPTEKFILLGFSAGCRPVRQLLATHPELHPQIAAVGLLADPWHPEHAQQNGVPDGPGYGVMGSQTTALPERTYYCGHPGDPIPRAAHNSLLRYVAAVADVVPGQFIAAFVHKARLGRLQLIPFLGLPLHEWFFGLGPRIDRSVAEAHAYLSGGHTTAYLQPYPTPDGREDPLVHRLAATLSWAVRQKKETA